MLFHPDADQRALITEAFSRPLDELLPLARLHRADGSDPHSALAGLGVFGVVADPDIGGVGLTAIEEALLAGELGYRLAGPRTLATMMAFHCADDALRETLVTGAIVVAPATVRGDEVQIFDGADADYLLLRGDGAAALVPADAVAAGELLDDDHWTVPIRAGSLGSPVAWIDEPALRRVRLLEAAALCGIAGRARDMAVGYAGLREQFGRPIGAFQAIKHRCADMAMAAMAASDLLTFAAVAIGQERFDAACHVEAALLLAIDAALGNARANVQIHGGIGFSEEADPHLLVKRAHLLVELCGGADPAADRVAAADPPMTRAA